MHDRTPTVGIVAFKDNKALLVEHSESAQHLTGVWGLPGGRLDDGESLLDAAAREFQEETGLIPDKSTMVQLPTVHQGDIRRKSGEILKTAWNVFLVKDYTGELMNSDETAPEWVPIEQVSQLSNLLPNTQNAISEAWNLLNI